MTDQHDAIETLRDQAEELGLAVDGRWGAERLRQEIAAHQPTVYDDEDEGAWTSPGPQTETHAIVGGRRSWTDGNKVKTTTVGSGLDRWYEQSPNWSPV